MRVFDIDDPGKLLRPYGIFIVVTLLALCLSACGVIRKRPEDKPSGMALVGKSMTSEQAKDLLGTMGGNFAYGPGLGDLALNVGAAVIFPPYVLYLIGNAALSLSGYEPVTISSILPKEDGKKWSATYDSIVSGPGRVVAALSGNDYRSQEAGEERLKAIVNRINSGEKVKDPAKEETKR